MQHHFHAVVWIDHMQARIFHIGLSGADEATLHPQLPTRHIHHKANSIGSGHVHESAEFLKQVMEAARIDTKRWTPQILMGIIQRWKDRGLTPARVTQAEDVDFAGGHAIDLYGDYQSRLRALNVADFGDA